MDSGNSGSMQSSSGGEEEYDDPRNDQSISSFLNPSAHFGSISDHTQASILPPALSHQPTNTLFNPHSQNNLDIFPSSVTQYSSSNHDLIWSRGLRSEPNFANLGNVTSSSSQSILSVSGVRGLNSQSTSTQPSQGIEATTDADKASLLQPADHHQPINVGKNPKKRTRASRKAPTTVLTTDTTNFRQMVQEFTGIPTAPFSAATSSPYARRFDLFSTDATPNMIATGPLGNSLGPLYPLRPSVQRTVQLSPFGPSSTTTTNTSNIHFASAAGAHDLGIPKQPQNLFNMQNQMLSFQPLLINKHHSSQANTSLSSFDELGLGHHDHQSVNANLSGWKDGGAPLNVQESLGGGSSLNVSNYKLNCSASTSEFHHDKGLENVTSGGEGTVGSWICPSD